VIRIHSRLPFSLPPSPLLPAGMTDVLNACDIDYVCLGNHETDIPHRAMLERVAESNFVWVGRGGREGRREDEERDIHFVFLY